jgi:hypothetical protein
MSSERLDRRDNERSRIGVPTFHPGAPEPGRVPDQAVWASPKSPTQGNDASDGTKGNRSLLAQDLIPSTTLGKRQLSPPTLPQELLPA